MATTKAIRLAEKVIASASARGIHLATAESCTGGLIAGCLTDIAGSSAVVEGGIMTYSNEAKQMLLGVSPATLCAHGAVSAQTAREMAAGALTAFQGRARLSVSVTGVAGPGGGTDEKPVGLVWFGVAAPDRVTVEKRIFPKGSRHFVRERTVETALDLLLQALARI
ncbi:CinA family protein [Aquisalinus flavus]|uniref:Competence damage-inducible protein A n=1 Tax=Aquisalinus flavus TaxID=1526572 RepID=A0A8J2V480_9PROT|nr:nicotinamide-nucleotide amidohydrolase family protein [Aquisalinus flavus]MBD0427762.1 CinA family protein [Aquisalinus flavus]UNE47536.1 CinA family protein [Aquisalinus flavus]GGD03626.1 competence damage-inducible protein A [Aquisalinus flavus]